VCRPISEPCRQPQRQSACRRQWRNSVLCATLASAEPLDDIVCTRWGRTMRRACTPISFLERFPTCPSRPYTRSSLMLRLIPVQIESAIPMAVPDGASTCSSLCIDITRCWPLQLGERARGGPPCGGGGPRQSQCRSPPPVTAQSERPPERAAHTQSSSAAAAPPRACARRWGLAGALNIRLTPSEKFCAWIIGTCIR